MKTSNKLLLIALLILLAAQITINVIGKSDFDKSIIQNEKLYGFDGWSTIMTKLIKEEMKDSVGYEHINTSSWKSGDITNVKTTYSGLNSSGERITKRATAEFDKNGNLKEINVVGPTDLKKSNKE